MNLKKNSLVSFIPQSQLQPQLNMSLQLWPFQSLQLHPNPHLHLFLKLLHKAKLSLHISLLTECLILLCLKYQTPTKLSLKMLYMLFLKPFLKTPLNMYQKPSPLPLSQLLRTSEHKRLYHNLKLTQWFYHSQKHPLILLPSTHR